MKTRKQKTKTSKKNAIEGMSANLMGERQISPKPKNHIAITRGTRPAPQDLHKWFILQ
jgi:hypothetical protein